MIPIRFCVYPQQTFSRLVNACLVIETPEGFRRIQDRHLYPMLREGKATLAPGTVELKTKPELFKLGAFR